MSEECCGGGTPATTSARADEPREEDDPGTRHPRRRMVLVGIGVVAFAAALLLERTSRDSTTNEREAVTFELPNVIKGESTVSLAQLRGRPVVLNFWASWCVPCRKEMPAFQAVAEQFDGQVAFVGVNHRDGRGGATDLLEETGALYPSAYDPKGSVAPTFRLLGMPSTVFISAEGRVLEKRTGEMSRSELEDTIREVFEIPNS